MNKNMHLVLSLLPMLIAAGILFFGKFESSSMMMGIMGIIIGIAGLSGTAIIYFKPKWLKIPIIIFLCSFFAIYSPSWMGQQIQQRSIDSSKSTIVNESVPVSFTMLSHPTNSVVITSLDNTNNTRVIDAGAEVIQSADGVIQVLVSRDVTYTILSIDGESIFLIDDVTNEVFRGPKVDLCKVLFLLIVIAAGVYVLVKVVKCGSRVVSTYVSNLNKAMLDPEDCPPPKQPPLTNSTMTLITPAGFVAMIDEDGGDYYHTTTSVTNGAVDWRGNPILYKIGTAIGPNAIVAVDAMGNMHPYPTCYSTNNTDWKKIGPQYHVSWLGYSTNLEDVVTHTTISFTSECKAFSTNWFWKVNGAWREMRVGDLRNYFPKSPQMYFRAGQ